MSNLNADNLKTALNIIHKGITDLQINLDKYDIPKESVWYIMACLACADAALLQGLTSLFPITTTTHIQQSVL